jgi:Tfp pilus assembly protein FimV
MADEFLRKVVLHTGANPRAFNNFIGNQRGYFGFEPTTDTFEVNKDFIDQPTLDQAAIDYQADQANADAAAAAADQAARTGDLQRDYGDDLILASVIEFYRQEINTLRQQHGLPDRSAGFVDGQIRAGIVAP